MIMKNLFDTKQVLAALSMMILSITAFSSARALADSADWSADFSCMSTLESLGDIVSGQNSTGAYVAESDSTVFAFISSDGNSLNFIAENGDASSIALPKPELRKLTPNGINGANEKVPVERDYYGFNVDVPQISGGSKPYYTFVVVHRFAGKVEFRFLAGPQININSNLEELKSEGATPCKIAKTVMERGRDFMPSIIGIYRQKLKMRQ